MATVAPAELATWLQDTTNGTRLVDLAPGVQYLKQHIPGAWFAIRAQLRQALASLPPATRYVFTCASESDRLAHLAANDFLALATDLPALKNAELFVLTGGTRAWAAQGLPLESGETHLANPRTDRYRRPYEGTDAPREAMQAYLDWEFGLVAQLGRDGTHHFKVI
jgi:rhodanese-related sulfurtransferase